MIKNKLIFQSIILLIFSVFYYLFPINSYAASFNLSINPPLLRVNIKPGKSITQVYKIDNNSTESKTLIVRVVPFVSSDKFGNPKIDPTLKVAWLDYFSLANSKIQINEPFEIAAGTSEQLILSLSVPDTAPSKDIYASLLISTYNNSVNNEFQGSSVKASIASNLLITVSNQLSPATILKISDFSMESGSFIRIGNFYIADSITPITFFAVAKNEGEFTSETKGVFRIQKGEKKPVQLQSILPQYIIAKSERKLTNSNDKDFNFTPTANMLGLYQAQIELHSDNANSLSQINIIFLPIKLILGFAVGLSLLLVITNISLRPTE